MVKNGHRLEFFIRNNKLSKKIVDYIIVFFSKNF